MGELKGGSCSGRGKTSAEDRSTSPDIGSTGQPNPTCSTSNTPPKLLDQLREAPRARHCCRRTETTYVQRVWRFVYFHRR